MFQEWDYILMKENQAYEQTNDHVGHSNIMTYSWVIYVMQSYAYLD